MRIFNEITVSILFLLLLALFLDPLMIFMPSGFVYAVIVGAIVVFAAFAGLVWRTRPADERDEVHQMKAGRLGYLLGTGVLLAGIVLQALVDHAVDPWLVAGVGAMVLGKLAGIYWAQKRM